MRNKNNNNTVIIINLIKIIVFIIIIIIIIVVVVVVTKVEEIVIGETKVRSAKPGENVLMKFQINVEDIQKGLLSLLLLLLFYC